MKTKPFDATKYLTPDESLELLREAYGEIDRLQDLVGKFQRGGTSTLYEENFA